MGTIGHTESHLAQIYVSTQPEVEFMLNSRCKGPKVAERGHIDCECCAAKQLGAPWVGQIRFYMETICPIESHLVQLYASTQPEVEFMLNSRCRGPKVAERTNIDCKFYTAKQLGAPWVGQIHFYMGTICPIESHLVQIYVSTQPELEFMLNSRSRGPKVAEIANIDCEF